jgi:uncharacterized membrane protein YoaK (UPF0700 family)
LIARELLALDYGSMFRHQGPTRSERQNGLLAGYLALIGGFVNSAGFILIGSFTSHVTGNVGRLATDIVSRQLLAAGAAFTMIASFYVGAFVASMIIESNVFERTPTAYGVALLSEALLLALFSWVAGHQQTTHARMLDMQAVLLCAAMGVQNSLVTRLSGAVVRTTHLTGVVTDLGIETARWFRWWRGHLSTQLNRKLTTGHHNPRERPVVAKIRLHSVIVSAFTLGAILGAMAGSWLHQLSMLLPSAAVGIGACYAFANARNAPLRTTNRPPSRPPAPIS